MIGTRLQEIEPGHNQRQDTIIFDWRGYQKVERS